MPLAIHPRAVRVPQELLAGLTGKERFDKYQTLYKELNREWRLEKHRAIDTRRRPQRLAYNAAHREKRNAKSREYQRLHKDRLKILAIERKRRIKELNAPAIAAKRHRKKANRLAVKSAANTLSKLFAGAHRKYIIQPESVRLSMRREIYRGMERQWARNGYKKNRDKLLVQSKDYHKKHKDAVSERGRLYRKNNKQKLRAYQKSYRAKNKCAYTCRSRIASAIRRAKKGKPFKSTVLLGCGWDTLKAHIESQFKPGMTWENHGLYGWHIDHIKSICEFDLGDQSQMLAAFNYKNLQPLWWKDNLSKDRKWSRN